MSEMFPNEYAVLFVIQLAVLMVSYLVLRLKTKAQMLTALCVSVLITAALTLLFLRFSPRSIVPVYCVGLKEYVAGTLFTAVPFMLVLVVQVLTPVLREIASGRKSTGPERARILHMIEEGKITAEEGGDLLEAMGRSSALQGQGNFSRLDMVILCGVALVVMGFFLPWAHIRISAMPGMQGVRDVFDQNSVYQSGYHTGALGWTIFVIALLSMVPVFVTPKDFLYKISILQLFLTLIGLLLVMSTLLRAGSHSGVGIVVCAVGFAIELIASGAKFRSLAA